MLTLTEHHNGATRILRLTGRLDGPGVTPLRARLAEAVAHPDTDITADLSGVTHLDGAGIGALAYLHRRLVAAGRRLDLAGAQGQPRACLRDLGLSRLMAA
jgi:anti-anti-sigma factor